MLAVAKFRARIRADHQRLRLGERLVRREPVVDVHTALVGNHIGTLAAGNQRGVQALLIGQAIYFDGAVLMCVQTVQNLGRRVDRVLAHPGAGRMRGNAVRDHVESHRAVAAALDAAIGRLADDREIAGDPIRMRLDHLAQAVLLGRDFLMVVKHVRQIVFRIRQRGRQIQHDRVGTLHIGGATTPDHTLMLMTGRHVLANQRIARLKPFRREIVDHRHRVEMAGKNHAALAAEIGGCHQCVAVPAHRQMRLFFQEHLDGVRQRAFVVADGIAAHDLPHQLVQLLLFAGGSGKSNREFVHAVHYPAKAGDNRISGVLLRRSAMLSCAW